MTKYIRFYDGQDLVLASHVDLQNDKAVFEELHRSNDPSRFATFCRNRNISFIEVRPYDIERLPKTDPIRYREMRAGIIEERHAGLNPQFGKSLNDIIKNVDRALQGWLSTEERRALDVIIRTLVSKRTSIVERRDARRALKKIGSPNAKRRGRFTL
jgi:hypothetical protein